MRQAWPDEARYRVGISESPNVFPAKSSLDDEERRFAVGRNAEGRYVFVVFTLRDKDGTALIRPISARFMHEKEVRNYERQKGSQDLPETDD